MCAWCLVVLLVFSHSINAEPSTSLVAPSCQKDEVPGLVVTYKIHDKDPLALFPASVRGGAEGISSAQLILAKGFSKETVKGSLIKPAISGSTLVYPSTPYERVTLATPTMSYHYNTVTGRGKKVASDKALSPSDVVGSAGKIGDWLAGAVPGDPIVEMPLGSKRAFGMDVDCSRIAPVKLDQVVCGGRALGFDVMLYSRRNGAFNPAEPVIWQATSVDPKCLAADFFKPDESITWR